jgi:DNA replication protein DnaC
LNQNTAVRDATPGQLGFPADLPAAQNAGRAESKRHRLAGTAGFPQSKSLEGYDRSMASFPADWGREQPAGLEFAANAEDLVLHGDVGTGKTHLAIALGMLARQRMIPVGFFTASSPVTRLRKAKDAGGLDREPAAIGKAEPIITDGPGHPPMRLRRGPAPVLGHR